MEYSVWSFETFTVCKITIVNTCINHCMYADSHQLFIIQWHSQKGIILSTPRENSENSPYYDIQNGGYTKAAPIIKEENTFWAVHLFVFILLPAEQQIYDCMGWLDSSLSAWALRPFLSSLAQFSFGPHQAKSAFEHAQKSKSADSHHSAHMQCCSVSSGLLLSFETFYSYQMINPCPAE